MNDEASATRIEGLLTRKSADLRRSVLELLLKQEDTAALGSAARLIASRQAPQRVAGLDLLGQMAAKNRSAENCRRSPLSLSRSEAAIWRRSPKPKRR
jgi:hypothetical protein